MNLLFKKEVIGNSPWVIRALINEIMGCINNWNQLDDSQEYEFRLVLNELISNGIFHGNKGFCDKKVKVAIEEVDPITLDILIKDEGKGFDHRKICSSYFNCDPLSFSEGGRGLMLVSSMCSNIQFNKNGNQIRIRKSIKKIL